MRIRLQNLRGHARWMRDIDENYIVDYKHIASFLFWALMVSRFVSPIAIGGGMLLFTTSVLGIDYNADGFLDTPMIIQEHIDEMKIGHQPGHTVMWHTHKNVHDFISVHLQVDPKLNPIKAPDLLANGFNGYGVKLDPSPSR